MRFQHIQGALSCAAVLLACSLISCTAADAEPAQAVSAAAMQSADAALDQATMTADPATAPGQRRALLIGISDYLHPDVSDLNGTLNDVARMTHVLTTRFGFAEDNIVTLLDAQATRAGMLAALEALAERSGPEDTVYIHFSGHGSQARDDDGEEDDGLDETLVPYDGRTAGIADITDDELGAIIARLRTKNVLVVLDSCHSGTGTRSTALRNRSAPADARDALYVAARDATPQITENDALGEVVMT
ncbi:MAG: caspase family protein, partial [Pseudomonadota bacterium]